ncbi:hypothetical protein MP228_007569 [Amoeboaphelidium protococcarum]|nr:hypothetical protein MP228_007569 [Amoeboaphelidium protococcarum]
MSQSNLQSQKSNDSISKKLKDKVPFLKKSSYAGGVSTSQKDLVGIPNSKSSPSVSQMDIHQPSPQPNVSASVGKKQGVAVIDHQRSSSDTSHKSGFAQWFSLPRRLSSNSSNKGVSTTQGSSSSSNNSQEDIPPVPRIPTKHQNNVGKGHHPVASLSSIQSASSQSDDQKQVTTTDSGQEIPNVRGSAETLLNAMTMDDVDMDLTDILNTEYLEKLKQRQSMKKDARISPTPMNNNSSRMQDQSNDVLDQSDDSEEESLVNPFSQDQIAMRQRDKKQKSVELQQQQSDTAINRQSSFRFSRNRKKDGQNQTSQAGGADSPAPDKRQSSMMDLKSKLPFLLPLPSTKPKDQSKIAPAAVTSSAALSNVESMSSSESLQQQQQLKNAMNAIPEAWHFKNILRTNSKRSPKPARTAAVPMQKQSSNLSSQASSVAAASRPETTVVRVFRREGTFVTLNCSMNSTARDLCNLLAKKFFIPADQAQSYKLYLVRREVEVLIEPDERPLPYQYIMLSEIGYDPAIDRFPDILREDNSYLYRWVYSNISAFQKTWNGISSYLSNNQSLQLGSQTEQKIADLVRMDRKEQIPFTDFDLSYMNLEDSLPDVVVKSADKVSVLNLSHNIMLRLTSGQTASFLSLTSLTLKKCQLSEVPLAVSLCTALISLDLSGNLISRLSGSGLESLTGLQELNLSNNHLYGRKSFPSQVLRKWSQLKRLDLSCNWIKNELPRSILLIGIKSQTLTGVIEQPFSKICPVEDGANALQFLDLSHNLITDLPSDFGYRLECLKTLSLSNNYLSALPSSITVGMNSLVYLDVRGNHLRGNAAACLSYNNSLKALPQMSQSNDQLNQNSPIASSCSHDNGNEKPFEKILFDNNEFTSLKIGDALPNLSTIVSHRNTSLLQLQLSQSAANLTSLVVCSSKLAFLPEDIFNFTPGLKILVLNSNQISTFPTSISSLKRLVRMEITHNSITRIPPGIKECQCLEILDLHANNIKDVPVGIWEMPLKILNLSSNVIEEFPDNPYATLSLATTEDKKKLISSILNLSDGKATLTETEPSVKGQSLSNTLQSASTLRERVGRNSSQSDLRQLTNISPRGSTTALSAPLASQLQWVSLADNRLESTVFDTFTIYLSNLISLNLAHNDIFSVPNGVLRNSANTLEQMFLSGNQLTQLPDDLYLFKRLERLFVNGNRLGTLPPEIGKLPNLKVLDAGRNQLRFNIANWPYDWNWNWNLELRYLNLSGNSKLEIKPNLTRNLETVQPILSGRKERQRIADQDNTGGKDLTKFDSLSKIRFLNLLEVGLFVQVPAESNTKRIRVYASGGASQHWRKQIGADSGLDQQSLTSPSGNSVVLSSGLNVNTQMVGTIQNATNDQLNVVPIVSYGISDSLNAHDQSNIWDLVLLDGKILQSAKDDIKDYVDDSHSKDKLFQLKKLKVASSNEDIFALFDGGSSTSSWCSKWLSDFFVSKFSSELKKIFKERHAKRLKANNKDSSKEQAADSDAVLVQASDNQLIQNALRRTFLLINKHLGGLAYSVENKVDVKEKQRLVSTDTSEDLNASKSRGRKASVTFDAPIPIKSKSGKKHSESHEHGHGEPSSGGGYNRLLSLKEFRRKMSGIDAFSNNNGGSNRLKVDNNNSNIGAIDESSENSLMADDIAKAVSHFSINPNGLDQQSEYWAKLMDDDAAGVEEELSEEAYLKLIKHGISGLIAYLVGSTLFVANCGDAMAVLSRNGNAVPLSTKHHLVSMQNAQAAIKIKVGGEISSTQLEKSDKSSYAKLVGTLPHTSASKSSVDNVAAQDAQQSKIEQKFSSQSKKELHRVRQTGGFVSSDGVVENSATLTRSFGQFEQLPHVNAQPYVSTTELNDADEFMIIASSEFWNTISFQTAIDIARLKADDALEAAMVLRDFALAHSTEANYVVDDDTEYPDEKRRIRRVREETGCLTGPVRYRKTDPFTVIVVNLRDHLGSKQKKVFQKVKRRKDETVDSAIARLAPEVEPPTGNVTLVFTDVRNSTYLWEKRPIAMRVAIREHNNIMRRNLRYYNGYEVKTEGDAFMVSFKNVQDALKWCIAIQLQLLEADWPQDILEGNDGKELFGPGNLESNSAPEANNTLLYRGLSIRMGVHCGAPVCELDPITRRMDYFGPVVNKTARICGAAEGGQIIVSTDVEKAWRKFRNSMPKNQIENNAQIKLRASFAEKNQVSALDPVFITLGEKKLKGFENAETLVSVYPKLIVARHRIPPPPSGNEQPQLPQSPDLGKIVEVEEKDEQGALLVSDGGADDGVDISVKSGSEHDGESHYRGIDTEPNSVINTARSVRKTGRQRSSSFYRDEESNQKLNKNGSSIVQAPGEPKFVSADETVLRQQLDDLCCRLEYAVIRVLRQQVSMYNSQLNGRDSVMDQPALAVVRQLINIPALKISTTQMSFTPSLHECNHEDLKNIPPQLLESFIKRIELIASTLSVAMDSGILGSLVSHGAVDAGQQGVADLISCLSLLTMLLCREQTE